MPAKFFVEMTPSTLLALKSVIYLHQEKKFFSTEINLLLLTQLCGTSFIYILGGLFLRSNFNENLFIFSQL